MAPKVMQLNEIGNINLQTKKSLKISTYIQKNGLYF